MWMIGNRIIQIRRGYIDPQGLSDIHQVIIQEKVAKIEKVVIQSVKRFFHYIAVTLMKGWVIIVHIIEKTAREKFPRLHNTIREKNLKVLEKKQVLMNTAKEYRNKMRMFRKKLREEDGLK
jgi:starvation-inducible outer membrane lipoprotein